MGVYINVLRSRLWIVLVTTIVTVAIVATSTYLAEPVYTATSKLRVVSFGIGQPDYGTFLYFEQLTSTISEIMFGKSVEADAKQQLAVDELPEFDIRVVPNTELLEIVVTGPDAELTMQAANTLTAILLNRISSLYSTSFASIEQSLGAQLGEIEAEINVLIQQETEAKSQLPFAAARVAEIGRQLEVRQNTYNSLLISYNEALVAQAIRANVVSVFEPATLPLAPSNRSFAFWIAVGTLIGLFGGIVLAFLLESLQPRLYTDQEIEKVSGVSVLGNISRIHKNKQMPLFRQDPRAVERMRFLRGNIDTHLATARKKTLLIGPLYPHIESSVFSYNLAVSLAHIHDRVLLVDADMRQPKLQMLVRLPSQEGLSDVLRGQVLLANTIQASNTPGLDLILAGKAAPDSTELLSASHLSKVVQDLQLHYDILIFNGPPFFAIADGVLLARMLDNTILLVNGQVLRQDVVDAVEILNQPEINFMGIVVNDSRRNAGRRISTY